MVTSQTTVDANAQVVVDFFSKGKYREDFIRTWKAGNNGRRLCLQRAGMANAGVNANVMLNEYVLQICNSRGLEVDESRINSTRRAIEKALGLRIDL